MSVTFTIEYREADVCGYALTCACGACESEQVATTYKAALVALDENGAPKCGDEFCDADPGHVTAQFLGDPRPAINVSNLNARRLLAVLGYPEGGDLVGEEDATLFLGRVMLAQVLEPTDLGVPATTERNCHNMGRRAGYTDDRLVELRDLAQWALDHDRQVAWA